MSRTYRRAGNYEPCTERTSYVSKKKIVGKKYWVDLGYETYMTVCGYYYNRQVTFTGPLHDCNNMAKIKGGHVYWTNVVETTSYGHKVPWIKGKLVQEGRIECPAYRKELTKCGANTAYYARKRDCLRPWWKAERQAARREIHAALEEIEEDRELPDLGDWDMCPFDIYELGGNRSHEYIENERLGDLLLHRADCGHYHVSIAVLSDSIGHKLTKGNLDYLEREGFIVRDTVVSWRDAHEKAVLATLCRRNADQSNDAYDSWLDSFKPQPNLEDAS